MYNSVNWLPEITVLDRTALHRRAQSVLGATSSLLRVPTKVPWPKPQRSLTLGSYLRAGKPPEGKLDGCAARLASRPCLTRRVHLWVGPQATGHRAPPRSAGSSAKSAM
jgi:hypothetical protein